MARQAYVEEMIEPTTALDALVENNIRPIANQLESLVREYLGLGASTPIDHSVRQKYCSAVRILPPRPAGNQPFISQPAVQP